MVHASGFISNDNNDTTEYLDKMTSISSTPSLLAILDINFAQKHRVLGLRCYEKPAAVYDVGDSSGADHGMHVKQHKHMPNIANWDEPKMNHRIATHKHHHHQPLSINNHTKQ